jgi:hypothetical protein
MSLPPLEQRPDDWPSRIGGGVGVGFAAGEPTASPASLGSQAATAATGPAETRT